MQRWIDQADLARMAGVVVPAYFSSKPTDEMVRHLLWMTLGDCHHYLPLGNVWVVVDGDERTARLVEEVRRRLQREQGATFHMLVYAENRGKFWAIRRGIAALLESDPAIQYAVIRDGDGDHAVADLPHLLRAAIYVAEARATPRVILAGARRSRGRPMGWLRGELEALLDQVTLDALAYYLARQGRALDLGFCLGQGAVPDLSSGYKVYSRAIAEELFVRHTPRRECLSEMDYWRYGVETVTIVEGLLAGATFAELLRLTWDGQPTTSFGEFHQVALYGELLAWVYARLRIPLDVAARFFDNHVPAMPLRTTAQGWETLQAVRAYALEKLRAHYGEALPIPPSGGIMPFL